MKAVISIQALHRGRIERLRLLKTSEDRSERNAENRVSKEAANQVSSGQSEQEEEMQSQLDNSIEANERNEKEKSIAEVRIEAKNEDTTDKADRKESEKLADQKSNQQKDLNILQRKENEEEKRIIEVSEQPETEDRKQGNVHEIQTDQAPVIQKPQIAILISAKDTGGPSKNDKTAPSVGIYLNNYGTE